MTSKYTRHPDTSKGVTRSRELSLATTEEFTSALRSQGVSDERRITIKRKGETTRTGTYILTFVTT